MPDQVDIDRRAAALIEDAHRLSRERFGEIDPEFVTRFLANVAAELMSSTSAGFMRAAPAPKEKRT
mgnify:CR=1 FL=1